MDVSSWQKRLAENFTSNGVVGGLLQKIIEMEKDYEAFIVENFHGQSVIIDSFQSFNIETIKFAQEWVATNGWPKNAPNYATILLLYVTNFRSFRACENLLMTGYPLDGYALLRDIKDRAIFLAGIDHNLTTFPAIYGFDEEKITSDEKRKKIIKLENKIFDHIVRQKSGLPIEVLEQITAWEQLFHKEVHGSKLTFFSEGGEWLLGKAALSIGPVPKESSIVMYMNRAVEVGWLLLRLFPYLQPVENAFGAEWIGKYKILDDSFRVMVRDPSEIGLKIADAFVFLVDNKFSFPDNFHYFEPTGLCS